jgi:translation initiation factor 2B subunit (eIF-2B alpha/beta/delta family)
MSAYFVVIKDGAIIDCTPDSSVATERFLSRGADRMEKASSLEDIQRICNTDWDSELRKNYDPEVVITNLWSYLNEGIERLGRRIRETEVPDAEEMRDSVQKTIERASNKVREAGKQGIEDLRELLDKLRRRKKLDEEEGEGEK